MQFRRAKKPSTALDMGPLIDCVLQLLIFFMLSSTFMSPKVRIELPQATASDGATKPDSIVVTAGLDGRVFVNQDAVAIEGLEPVLRPLIDQSPTKAVIFRGDQAIPYGTFIQVIDAARRAGAKDLDIAHTLTPRRQEPGDGP
jgi:biopolymer transport protein ExbD